MTAPFSYKAAAPSLASQTLAKAPSASSFFAPKSLFYKADKQWEKKGHSLIQAGKVVALMAAGGVGSRLGYPHPKGMYPITCVEKKSLFQYFCEKVRAASAYYQRPLPLVILLSAESFEKVQIFFSRHRYFGLQASQIFFLCQASFPYLINGEQSFLNERKQPAEGPSGNGAALELLYQSGLLDHWLLKGVDTVSFFQVDNPLAEPYDPSFIGFHSEKQYKVSLKAILRQDPSEHVGILVEQDNKLKVVEYSEISLEDQQKKASNGQHYFQAANTSMLCLGVQALKSILSNCSLPLHPVVKGGKRWCEKKNQLENVTFVKYEKFIFDILNYLDKKQAGALIYPREQCFAPLKHAEGSQSIQEVQKALLRQDQQQILHLFGQKVFHKEFEISPEFYYPNPFLIHKHQNTDFLKTHYLAGSWID